METPNTVTVTAEVTREILANAVRMHVEIRGTAFFSGNSALKKAEEVRDLVEALGKLGIEEKRIQMLSVRAAVSSGFIGKSSSAVYLLRIDIPTLDLLADTLGVVTSQKNAEITTLEWQYDNVEQVRREMLAEALQRAEGRSALICSTLAHRNLGVHALTEMFEGGEKGGTALGFSAKAKAHGRSFDRVGDFPLSISHSKMLSLQVQVQYLVERDAAAR